MKAELIINPTSHIASPLSTIKCFSIVGCFLLTICCLQASTITQVLKSKMAKIIILALAFGVVAAVPLPDPLTPGMPGAAVTTTHLSSTSAHHHHHGGYGLGMGYTMGAYPGVVKHTETVSSAGYPAAAALTYNSYSAYPGLAGLGYGTYTGFPAAKQYTQVTTTAVRPGMYGYF